MAYTLGSLFSGIGGIDLAFSREGFDIRWQVEIDPFCRQVLAKHSNHWPNAKVHEDVHEVGKHNLSAVDVMAGGFPCQPVSSAGKRQAQEDSRWLWPQFARIIGEVRPRVVFLENVPGILNPVKRRRSVVAPAPAFEVLADLTALGYDATWAIVPASIAGAAHKRARFWCVAYPSIVDTKFRFRLGASTIQNEHGRTSAPNGGSNERGVGQADAQIARLESVIDESEVARSSGIGSKLADATSQGLQGAVQSSQYNPISVKDQPDSQSLLGRAIDGLPRQLDGVIPIAGPGQVQYSWEAPRTKPKGLPDRASRLKALGNAVYVPLVQVFAAAIRQELEARDRLQD